MKKSEELFGIDLRSLACFRVCLGVVLLVDLVSRARDLTAHYTDAGVLPLADLSGGKWSVHMMTASWEGQAFLFCIAAVFASMFLLGYCTRLANIVSWYLLCSLHARNPVVLQGGDTLLLVLLFWSIFLPHNAGFQPKRVLSFGTAAILLQMCFMYWFSVVFKWNPDWLEGKSVYYALHIDQFTTPLGVWLRSFPHLLSFLTFAVFWAELLLPIFVFFPFWTQRIRIFVVGCAILLHLSFGISLELGLFPYICMIGWLLFLPSRFWSKDMVPCVHGSWFANSLAAILLIAMFLWNIDVTTSYHVPQKTHQISRAFHLRQKWNMFSRPLRYSGWYVVPGKLRNGQIVDLLNPQQPLRWEKPLLVSVTYRNQRWRKYLMNLSQKNYKHFLKGYAHYLAEQWNADHDEEEHLDLLQIVYMAEFTEEGGTRGPVKKHVLWTFLA